MENKNLIYSFLAFISIFLILAVLYIVFFKENVSSSPKIQKEYRDDDVNKKNIVVNSNQIPKPSDNDKYKYKNQNAKYTIVNYFSLDCIHCQNLWKLEDKDTTGIKNKINLIYRQTSLFSQPLSGEKNLIAECLYKETNEDDFFEFINQIYNGEPYINTQKNNNWIKEKAVNFIKNKNGNINKFSDCIENEENKKAIQNQKNTDIIQGIKFTPTLIIFDNKGNLIKKYENVGGIVGLKIMQDWANK